MLQEEHMQENSMMVNKMAKEHSHTQMAQNILVHLEMDKDTVREIIHL